MIPLRDSVPRQNVPIVNYTLLCLSIAAFGWQISVWDELDLVFESYALVPARFLALGARASFASLDLYTPFITSVFLHGGVAHIAFNMLFLWIFGDNVEDRFGHVGYACFYLLGGAAAGAAHVIANPGSLLPTVGASGAVAAVMGAYFLLHPGAWITSIIPPLFWITFRVPAVLYLAFWFATQILMGHAALDAGAAGVGVAWWAHAGGFAFGLVVILVFGRHRR